jgi:glyoxylase-like metal-dependent hydrolase (beta-lactamase superfamily II)
VIAHRAFSFGTPLRRPDPQHVEVSAEDLAAHAAALERERTHSTRRVASLWASLKRISTPPPWKGPKDRLPLRQRLRLAALRAFGRGRFVPEITQHVEHGDVLQLAGREWFVLHTPGHTADHICLHDPDSGAFMTGDHVLPSITPHINGVSYVRDPLKSFFYSLDRVGEIKGVSVALPAHGHPFDDLRARADAIKAHHHERLEKLVEISRAIGRGDVNSYMKQLFSQRSWGEMAESETYAHLEHLRLEGRAEAWRDERGRLVYAL